MKRSLLAVAALALGVTPAFSITYYVAGDFNGWNVTGQTMTETSREAGYGTPRSQMQPGGTSSRSPTATGAIQIGPVPAMAPTVGSLTRTAAEARRSRSTAIPITTDGLVRLTE